MAQLKEASVVCVAGPDLIECPFDCGHQCLVTNEFNRAEGKAFHDNISGGVRSARAKQNANGDFENDLSTIGGVPKPTSNVAFPNDWGWAAHHLIPVGALNKNKLMRYLDKGKKGSEVSCNVGYNVNGVKNGVWLIGSGLMQKNLNDPEIKDLIAASLRRAGIQQKKNQTTYSAIDRKSVV